MKAFSHVLDIYELGNIAKRLQSGDTRAEALAELTDALYVDVNRCGLMRRVLAKTVSSVGTDVRVPLRKKNAHSALWNGAIPHITNTYDDRWALLNRYPVGFEAPTLDADTLSNPDKLADWYRVLLSCALTTEDTPFLATARALTERVYSVEEYTEFAIGSFLLAVKTLASHGLRSVYALTSRELAPQIESWPGVMKTTRAELLECGEFAYHEESGVTFIQDTGRIAPDMESGEILLFSDALGVGAYADMGEYESNLWTFKANGMTLEFCDSQAMLLANAQAIVRIRPIKE